MTRQQHFDAIIIGSGTSAYWAIDGLNQAGKKVAVIDERPYGGTCALRGCQPKKYLVANAEAIAMSRDLGEIGIAGKIETDWSQLQKLKNDFLDQHPASVEQRFKDAGVTTIRARAQMISPDTVQAGDATLSAETIVIATGATPRITQIPGSEHVRDSEHFLDMPELPRRIVFIGGGYISFEFAHVAAMARAEVTILHRSGSPLKAFDPDMVDVVLEASRALGVRVVTDETPTEITATVDGYEIRGKSGNRYGADLIVEATGRTPNLGVLDGNAGEIEHSPRGIQVNEYLQSVSNPRVYAIGDCADTPYQLATVADEEGKIVTANILHGHTRSVDYSVVPTAVFTLPPIGTVGLTEAQAVAAGRDFRINSGRDLQWPSSLRIGEKHSGFKILVDNQDDTIIGAHIARHNAAEVINIFALAIRFGIKAPALSEFLWAYPTYSSDLKYMVRDNRNC